MVKVYSRPNCQACRLTKKRLADREIEFEELDYDTAGAEVADLDGIMALPVVIAGQAHWGGFKPDLIDALAQ